MVRIEKLAFGGNGICRIDGKVCFVPFSCPGDEVLLEITETKRSYLIARIANLLVPSEQRKAAVCPLFGKCGGCSWQHIDYNLQLQAKHQILSETLWRGARIEADRVGATISSPLEFNYRRRVQFKLAHGNGGLKIGFYRHGTHDVEDVGPGCPIAHNNINKSLTGLRAVIESFPEKECISGITIECNDQQCVAIIKHIGNTAPDVADYFRRQQSELPALTGLCLQTGRKDILSLYGDDTLSYTLPGISSADNGCTLSYRVGGFSQVNHEQNMALLEIIRRLAGFQGNEKVLDLYCGNGNFTLPISNQVSFVSGIEEYEGSIVVARENCRHNNIKNVDFICTDVVTGVKRIAEAGGRFDTVLLDPPRTGAAGAVKNICLLQPSKIIYVSCDPNTLARDCSHFSTAGYRVDASIVVDMFPQTYHIESVTLLQKK